jgi:serine/threonine protein kinase
MDFSTHRRLKLRHDLGEPSLDRGGMATVYLARDLKHERPVALKVLFVQVSDCGRGGALHR